MVCIHNTINHETGGVCAPSGFKASGVAAGIKKAGVKDVALVVSEKTAAAAGVFTTNKIKAAPVELSRSLLRQGQARAVVINSGNANACNGKAGMRDAEKMCGNAAGSLGISKSRVLVASTGIIGVPLPMDKVSKGIRKAAASLAHAGGKSAAEAIMTTDTYAKEAAVSFKVSGKRVTIGGMAKGAGMIRPDMATMIAVITTDALISPVTLKKSVRKATERTFNCITVDGDMSTNDSVIVLANGMSGAAIGKTGKALACFNEALEHVMLDLAEQMVKDGEGATKFIKINVTGARNGIQAKMAALNVADSLLVKCACFGEDANWGRILASLGSSGAEMNADKVTVKIGNEIVYRKGSGVAFRKEAVDDLMKANEIDIGIDINEGGGNATILTTDLSTEYVKINAHYRT